MALYYVPSLLNICTVWASDMPPLSPIDVPQELIARIERTRAIRNEKTMMNYIACAKSVDEVELCFSVLAKDDSCLITENGMCVVTRMVAASCEVGDVARWIYTNFLLPRGKSYPLLTNYACCSGDVELTKWFYERNGICEEDALIAMPFKAYNPECQDVTALNWLLDHMPPHGEFDVNDCLYTAARKANKTVVSYLLNLCPENAVNAIRRAISAHNEMCTEGTRCKMHIAARTFADFAVSYGDYTLLNIVEAAQDNSTLTRDVGAWASHM